MTSVEEFNCILCKESFDNKDDLQTHFRKHGDPKFNESAKKNRVQNEPTLPLTSDKSNDASEMVNCDVCEETFPTISKAITHKHKVHPEHDAKYFCPWCGKLFTMKHLYNKHLQTNHDAVDVAPDDHDNNFHCDCCSVYFNVSSAMIYHNKFFHRQDTDLPIIGHSKKQRLWNQDLLPVYYCSFCGEEYINKVNLHKHICDDHGDENQRPTDVLRCPLCEAIFYHLDAYELHLTFHSSNDLYSETNEMNENELSEYSLETVPPAMERVEDLNNLPNIETDVNAIGIESFLQMAMDEPHDSNQRSKKVKSKKHKKHKKSKKSAITLDEFLNMNQDVFGEGLDFQGVEEVPTKVIKRQLIPRKPQIPKSGAKCVSSADLQKLQKAGIVVKMKSGNKPPPLKIRPVGQPVKVNPRVKNLANQTQTKAISASNEVLSKLMNQSSNQLKIVKKTVPETTNNDETAANEPVIEDTRNQPSSEDLANPNNVEMDCDVENFKNRDEKTNLLNTNPNVLIDQNNEGKDLNDCKASQKSQENDEKNDQINNDMTKSNAVIPGGNSTVTSGNDFKDTLKNISRQITIKSITPAVTKANVQSDLDKPFSPKGEQFSEFVNDIPCNNDLKTDQIQVNSINKTLDPLRNINSAVTIKSQKNGNISIDNRNSTIVQEKSGPNITQSRLNAPDKVPAQKNQPKIENTSVPAINKVESDKIKETTSSHVLKNLSKNITVTSKSPSINQLKDDNTNKEQDDSEFDEYDENPTENKDIQKPAAMNLGIQNITSSNVLKNLGKNITIKSMTPSVKQLNEDNENKEQDDSEFYEYDENPGENKNIRNLGSQQGSSSNVLKNLRKNIIVKSTSPSIKQLDDNINNEQHDSDFTEYDENPMEKKNVQKFVSTNLGVQVATSSHVLKNLSKNIIVKSTSQFVKQPKEDNTDEEEAASELDAYDESPVENKTIKKVVSTNLGMPRNAIPRPKIAIDRKQKPTSRLPCAIAQQEENEEYMSKQFADDVKNSNVQSNNLLKHLKNITAKPVPTSKKSQQITAASSNTTVNIAKGNNYTWKSVQKNESTEEIETFNIDDSDSDDAGQQQMQQMNTAPKKIEPIKNEVKPNPGLNAIKNKSQHITVKSSNNQTKQTKHCLDINRHDSDVFSDDENHSVHHQSNDVFEEPRKTFNNLPTTYKATTQKDETFKEVFKNLGKHITIKSKTTSSQSIQHASLGLKHNTNTANKDSDEDPVSGKVKITDVTEDNFSDDDINNFENTGIVTHSSEGSNSGDDNFPEDMDEFDEYESQPLAINAINHDLKSPSESLLKNISKNITVKSLSDRNVENIGRCNVTPPERDQIVNQNKFCSKLSVRPINQSKPDIRNQSATSRSQISAHNKRIAEASTSNQSAKSIVPESSDVVNTINKEVKVKTFQSETVIEEVTTTVTKTIRRVNQVNQQVYNASQTSTAPQINQQKNSPKIGNYNQQTKNFQGIPVRQTSPSMMSPKIRQTIPFRPATGTPIRPSNQLVPIRPNANIRPSSSPRMQIKNMPQQQRSLGKPLKIAPNAMNQLIKRPATEDTSGPFSCFKKPKESLIPGHETAAGSSSDFHYTSSSQTSKFCSTAKIVKDNAVVTKTQMRSESITQQQQMGRHGNISGLKIAQSKQVSQVERSEANASKRSALEAIEKLQKQGLLIKKPKVVEEDFDSPNSDGEYNEEFQDEEE